MSEEKRVVFTLDAVASPQARAVLQRFGADLEAAQNRVATLAKTTAANVASSASKAMGGATGSQAGPAATVQSANQAIARALEERAGIHNRKRAEEAMKEDEFFAKRAAALKKFTETRDKYLAEGGDKGASSGTSKEYSVAAKEWSKMLAEHAKIEEAKTKKQTTESEKRIAQSIKENQAAAKKAERDTERAVRDQEKYVESAAAKWGTLQEKVRSARRETLQAAVEMTGSVMQLARGFTALGLVGEKDLAKVTDGLLTVQAAFDIVGGSAKIIIAIDKIMMGLRNTTLATAAAQEILNAAQSKGVALQLASTPKGMIGGLAGGVMGGAGRAASMVGASGVGAGAVGTALSGIAAVGGALFGLAQTVRFVRDAMQNGIGGGSTSGGIGSSGWNPFRRGMEHMENGGTLMDRVKVGLDPFGMFTETTLEAQRRKQGKRTDAMGREVSGRAAMNAEDTERISGVKTSRDSNLNTFYAMDQRRLDTAQQISTMQEKQARLAMYVADYENRVALGQAGSKEALLGLYEKQYQLAQETANIERQAAKDSLDAADQSLSKINDRIRAEREGMMSAKEAFGLRSAAEQKQLIDLKTRLDKGENLTPEQLQKLRGISKTTDDLVGGQASALADKGGFGVFEAEYDRGIKQLEEMKAMVEVDVEYSTELVVKTDFDAKKIAKEFNDKITGMILENEKKLIEEINKQGTQIDEITARMNRRNNQGF